MTENKKIIGKINIDLIKGEFTPKFYLIDAGGRMTKKYRVHDLAKFHYSEIGEYIDENHTDRPLRNDILVDLINQLNEENEQLKQQLNDITLNWTQNHLEFDKDELYVKDNNTEITLKGQNFFIQVFIPKIKEYFRFNYIVTGRRLEKEYNTLKGDVE